MAKIDLARRAQIGRDRRAKTRARLMQAARALYAERAIETVTIDDLVNEAGVAKGTFLCALRASHGFAGRRR